MDKKNIVPSALKSCYTDWHFSPAIKSGDFLFVSGCTGAMPGKTISPNIEEQIRTSFRKIEMSLDEAGLTFDDIVEMTTYHVSLKEHIEDFKRIKDEFINEIYPAWTAIGISELAVEVKEVKYISPIYYLIIAKIEDALQWVAHNSAWQNICQFTY